MQLALSAIGAAVGSAKVVGSALLGGLGGGGSVIGGILQGVATAGSILGTLAAGNAKSDSYMLQAGSSDLAAQKEQTAGMKRSTGLKRELMKVLSDNDVAFAAAGIDIGTGAAADARNAAETRATQELSIDRADTDARIAERRAEAAGYRRNAKSAKRGALFQAIGQGASFGASLMQRG